MSGIVGIVQLNGAPVSPTLVQQLTTALSYRGPDAQNIWVKGAIGLGHTLLRTTWESAVEQQPFSFDNQVWIVADARIDQRSQLLEQLGSQSPQDLRGRPDVELILAAYLYWGEACVQHLLGDFVFAIWDARKQRLFCARDPLGVKPFYYSQQGSCLIFSNTLPCLRLHPQVSNRLNESAIADFLLFELNQNPQTTPFADIQRLPAAHSLICTAETTVQQRYWSLPISEPIRYQHPQDYVDHYRELMNQAVSDRLRTDRVAIFMSGGMDSTTIAAVAKSLMSGSGCLKAYTAIYDRLISDPERDYAAQVAETLGIPIQYLSIDDYILFAESEQLMQEQPEPINSGLLAFARDQFAAVSRHARVVLDGNGGDPVLLPSSAYFLNQLGRGQVRELGAGLWHYWQANRQLPRLGLRTSWRKRFHAPPVVPPLVPWLQPEWVDRLGLQQRWQDFFQTHPQILHPLRPEASRELQTLSWVASFEREDPGTTHFPVEVRHPYFDLRLIEYLLAVPPFPWFVNKHLVRIAMQGILPEGVRRRPKTPLAGDPIRLLLRQHNYEWIDRFSPTSLLERYVQRSAVPSLLNAQVNVLVNLRPISLNYWLRQFDPSV